MGTLAGVTRKHLQYAYAGLQKSLQQEWAFVQRVTPGIGDAIRPVEKALRETFFLYLFEGLRGGAPGRGVTRLPVKQAGLALPYLTLTLTVHENWTASYVSIGHLITSLRFQLGFQTANHSA